MCNPSAKIDWADIRAELTNFERRFGADDRVAFDENPRRDEGLLSLSPDNIDDDEQAIF